MQEITKKNLNSEKLWNFRAWENSGNGNKEMSLPLFFILKKKNRITQSPAYFDLLRRKERSSRVFDEAILNYLLQPF